MGKNYLYKESQVVFKKMAGIYNAETVDIEVDDKSKNVIDELKVFNGQFVEITVKIKKENDLGSEGE